MKKKAQEEKEKEAHFAQSQREDLLSQMKNAKQEVHAYIVAELGHLIYKDLELIPTSINLLGHTYVDILEASWQGMKGEGAIG